ncbi:hypothetical protein KKB55_10740, partial [Myxococcota bacterium]|nr:hypothetical protein [Myxococcota bacterium]
MSVTQAEAWARVRHYGADPTHFQVLNEGARRWIWEETLIGYTEAAGFWITIGPPVGPEAAAVTALRRFAA